MRAKHVNFLEARHRSVVKALTFRVIILCADAIIIYAITKRIDITFGVVFASNISSTILYILHERAWNKIYWGKSRKK